MMKILRKGAILLVIFVAVVAGTSFLMNSQSTDNRSDMNDATLPEVMVKIGSTQANKMYGYRQQMQTDFMRGSITPLDTTKKVSFEINPYADTVTGLAYEVRTSDGSKVMENRKIKNLTKEDNGCLSTEIEIGSDLRMNQEYSMQITLDTRGGSLLLYKSGFQNPVEYRSVSSVCQGFFHKVSGQGTGRCADRISGSGGYFRRNELQ